jgi:glucose/arabinose dehydrogenase
VFATGLRNSMGMDWAPWNDALYATDNGRDMLGDDYPPCELNKLEAGNFYGWPYYNGANEPDPDYGKEIPSFAANAVAPAHEFRAHNAPLGMSFVDSSGWPQWRPCMDPGIEVHLTATKWYRCTGTETIFKAAIF